MPTNILEITNLNKSFSGLGVIKDLNFSVRSKEIFSIIGANGAGKTTLFNLIVGKIKPDSGKIVFEGKNITNLLPNTICEFGIVSTSQIPQPFLELTVLENVMVGAILRFAGATDSREYAKTILFDFDLDNKKNCKASTLTLSELKKLELARAVATQPKILMLDEVMAGLRDLEIEEISKLLISINQKQDITILMIEHVIKAIIKLSQETLVINNGEKIIQGKTDEVLKNSKVIDCYLGHD
jgi:branched-chain amino acid transport system ATP-binding protein